MAVVKMNHARQGWKRASLRDGWGDEGGQSEAVL